MVSPSRLASSRAHSAPPHRRAAVHIRASDAVSRRAVHRGSVAVVAVGGVGDAFSQLFNKAQAAAAQAAQTSPSSARGDGSRGATNATVRVVNGMKHKRLGGGDIIVSELGLGTQRWGGADANSPDAETCEKFLDYAILERGCNLIDTPSSIRFQATVCVAKDGRKKSSARGWPRTNRDGTSASSPQKLQEGPT